MREGIQTADDCRGRCAGHRGISQPLDALAAVGREESPSIGRSAIGAQGWSKVVRNRNGLNGYGKGAVYLSKRFQIMRQERHV